jgi:pimeloyl-ACP methyl ester carboxylesterase
MTSPPRDLTPDDLAPRDMAVCHVRDLRIAYERAGVGSPLLLLHGYVGDAITTFGPVVDELRADFDVVAVDLPGAGRSTDPPETFRLPDYADAVAGLLTALRLAPVHLLGLSFGAALALEVYRRHRSAVRSLVLVSGYAGWKGSLDPDETQRRLDQALRLADLEPRHFASAVAASMFRPAAPSSVVRDFVKAAEKFHPPGLRAMARSVAEADLRDVLPTIGVPTLVVAGELDVRAPLSVANDLHAGIPASRLVTIPNVGHLCTVEAPSAVTNAVRSFLQGVTSKA